MKKRLVSVRQALTALAATTALCATTAHAQTCPARAARFMDSLGVNTHFSNWTAYTAPGTQARMNYLGIHNIRDAIPPGRDDVEAEMETLGKAGIRFTILQSSNNDQTVNLSGDMAQIIKLLTASPGSVISYEGTNEYNLYQNILNGQPSQGNLAWGNMDNWTSINAMAQSPRTSGLPYIAASTGGVGTIPFLQASANYANEHAYSPLGQQLTAYLQSGIAAASASLSGGPVVVTETGISSVPVAYTTWGTAGDERTQATIDTNAFLDAFKDGAYRTFLYDLNAGASLTDQESQFGLFRPDGSSKPVADEIHNLTTVVQDTGATAAWFQTTSLPMTISGMPSGAMSLLLQKANGNYELVLWNASATVWSNGAEAYVPLTNVAVNFGSTFTTVNIYAVAVGSTPLARLGAASSLVVGLGKDPLVIELSDRWTPAASSPVCTAL